MESTVNTLENNITINILKMRDNFGLERDRQKQIYREIQSFIDPAMNKKIPEVIEPSLIESYLKKPEFITYLLSKIPSAFEHIPEQFKNDKKYVLMAVKESYTVLQYIQSNFTNDPEVIKTAIKGLDYKKEYNKNSGNALCYASEELKNNKELVLLAVKETGTAIQYASEELKNDPEVIKAAILKDKGSFAYLSEKLKDDKKFVIESIKQFNPKVLSSIPSTFIPNYLDVSHYSKQDQVGSILTNLSNRLKDDKEVVFVAIENENNFSLKDVSDRLKNNKEVVLKSIKKQSNNIQYASESLRNDRELVYLAIKLKDQTFDKELLKYASEDLQKIVNEKGINGLLEKPTSQLTSIIKTLRDLTKTKSSQNNNTPD